MKIRRRADGYTVRSNFSGEPKNEILHLFAVNRLAGKKIEVKGKTVIQVEESKRTAT